MCTIAVRRTVTAYLVSRFECFFQGEGDSEPCPTLTDTTLFRDPKNPSRAGRSA